MIRKKMDYEHVDRNILAVYLAQQQILAAEDLGSAHVYSCQRDKDESLVIALPDGTGLIVSSDFQAAVDRRRVGR